MVGDRADKMYRNKLITTVFASLPVEEFAQTIGHQMLHKRVLNVLAKEAREKGGSRPAFRYYDKGSLATIGRGKAVADIKGRFYGGFFAWLVWSVVHIAFLVGFRNRTIVMMAWAWKYLTLTEAARLITGVEVPVVKKPTEF